MSVAYWILQTHLKWNIRVYGAQKYEGTLPKKNNQESGETIRNAWQDYSNGRGTYSFSLKTLHKNCINGILGCDGSNDQAAEINNIISSAIKGN